LPDGDYAGDQPSPDDGEGLDVTELRKQFTDYVTIKQSEILEARTALKYYHGDQWTKEQLDTLQARGQPAITFNRVGRKIDGLVGVLEKLRGDPKAVGRIENDEQGAEISTQCIRYALDMSRFAAQETEALRKGACTGIVIAELGIVPGDKLDPDIDVATVDATTFFYDPRSLKLDFSDTLKKQSDAKAAAARAVHSLALAHHETVRAHATSTDTAIDTFEATQAQPDSVPSPGAPQTGPQGQPHAPAPPGDPRDGQAVATLLQAAAQRQGQAPSPAANLQIPPPGGPPYGGAVRGPDGVLRVPDPHNPNQWLSPGAPVRPVPGGSPVRARDAQLYVHAPHPGGLYQRVVMP
jgi:hypothetical protein